MGPSKISTNLILLGFLIHPVIGTPQTSEGIRVRLLGQPCLLKGPLEEKVLKSIHLVGPDQMVPEVSTDNPSASEARLSSALTQLENIKNLPSVLYSYRDHLRKRLVAQKAFFESWKNPSSDNLMLPARNYLRGEKLRNFETTLSELIKSNSPEKREQLLEIYNEGIEADPESEFHRSLRKLKVEYHCSFDEELE